MRYYFRFTRPTFFFVVVCALASVPCVLEESSGLCARPVIIPNLCSKFIIFYASFFPHFSRPSELFLFLDRSSPYAVVLGAQRSGSITRVKYALNSRDKSTSKVARILFTWWDSAVEADVSRRCREGVKIIRDCLGCSTRFHYYSLYFFFYFMFHKNTLHVSNALPSNFWLSVWLVVCSHYPFYLFTIVFGKFQFSFALPKFNLDASVSIFDPRNLHTQP